MHLLKSNWDKGLSFITGFEFEAGVATASVSSSNFQVQVWEFYLLKQTMEYMNEMMKLDASFPQAVECHLEWILRWESDCTFKLNNTVLLLNFICPVVFCLLKNYEVSFNSCEINRLSIGLIWSVKDPNESLNQQYCLSVIMGCNTIFRELKCTCSGIKMMQDCSNSLLKKKDMRGSVLQ